MNELAAALQKANALVVAEAEKYILWKALLDALKVLEPWVILPTFGTVETMDYGTGEGYTYQDFDSFGNESKAVIEARMEGGC